MIPPSPFVWLFQANSLQQDKNDNDNLVRTLTLSQYDPPPPPLLKTLAKPLYVSFFSLYYFSSLPLPECFTTEQSSGRSGEGTPLILGEKVVLDQVLDPQLQSTVESSLIAN